MAGELQLVFSAQPPADRHRDGENKPEERRERILRALKRLHVELHAAPPASDASALEQAVSLGVLSAELFDFFKVAHSAWAADGDADISFTSSETAAGDGLVPYFFSRTHAGPTESVYRRLSWHATDSLTPIFADTFQTLCDDAEVMISAARVACEQPCDVYALPTHPGHHAALDRFGGYCYVNNVGLLVACLRQRGRVPFVVDVDYHAGDGTSELLPPERFVSLHAADDYPYVRRDAEWAIPLPPKAGWSTYEHALASGLLRIPADADVLVVSLGFDTVAGDPDARPGHGMELLPVDFAAMHKLLQQPGRQVVLAQEGGYNLEAIELAVAQLFGAAAS